MSLIDKSAPQLVIPSALELWKTLPTNLAVQDTDVTAYHPVALFNPESGTISYLIPENSEDYPVLDDIELTGQLKITKANGNDIDADEFVGFENNGGDTIFSRIEVELGDQTVESDNHYQYKAYVETAFTKEESALKSQGSSTMWMKDTAGQMNTQYKTAAAMAARAVGLGNTWLTANPQPQDPAPTPAQIAMYQAFAMQKGLEGALKEVNHGFQKRVDMAAGSRRIWFRTKPKLDIFSIGKYIPNGVGMKVTFHRSKPMFALHAPYNEQNPVHYKIQIFNPILWVKRAKIFPTVFMGQDRNITVKPARYNVRRTVIKPVTIPQGTTSFTIDNVTVGQVPRRVLVGFVNNTAFDGRYDENPFNFQHMNLTKIAMYVNGKCNPSTPYTPRYTGENIDYGREYNGLLSVLGMENTASTIDISREEYPNGYCLYGFDLSPDKKAARSAPLYLKKTGNTRIEFQLGTATAAAIVCIIFAEYDNIMKIDGDRNVFVNYNM